MPNPDPVLQKIVDKLVQDHRCHTVLLYGSRARGGATKQSDYDVMGVRRGGKKYRVAEYSKGSYLDLFIYPEKDLKKIGEAHLYMKGAKVIFQTGRFGDQFIAKLNSALKKPYRARLDDIQVSCVWAHKTLARVAVGDIEGLYRRAVMHEMLLSDYFLIRKKRYWGPKPAFAWLRTNDRRTYNLFEKVLKKPDDLFILKKLVERVTHMKVSQ